VASPIPDPPPRPPPRLAAAQGSRLSKRARKTIIAVVVIVIVVIGIIGYAAVGFAYATARVATANKSLNTVISHQNSTFKDINTKFNALSTSSTSDPKQARALLDQFVADAKSAGTTVDRDDASLVSAKSSLKERQWLTLVSRGSLDKETARIEHARTALAEAKTIAADYVQVGEFNQAFLDVIDDFDTFVAQTANADLPGARGTLASLSTNVNKALQLSTAPGLPSELHNLMVDYQTLVADFGKLLDAVAANNDKAIISADATIKDDADKIGSYDVDKINADIRSYYKPLLDIFSSEIAKATAS
jgi:hypothetical protein